MAKKLKEVKISRKKWHRGGHAKSVGGSRLQVTLTGRQCCLGFLARVEGYKSEDIAGVFYPSGLLDADSVFPAKLLAIEYEIGSINDTSSTSDKQKEKAITRLFKEAGYKAVFVP